MANQRIMAGKRVDTVPVNYSQNRGRPYHPAVSLVNKIPANADTKASAKSVSNQIALESSLLASKLIHRSPYETVDLVGVYQNNATHGIAPEAVNVVLFQCPNGCVLMVDQLAVFYSDPLVAASIAVGWRLTINGGQAPNVREINTSYFYTGFGDISHPNRIHPLWVQSGQTVALQVNPAGTFGEFLTVTCRISGKLFTPATPQILGV